jgi:anti-anti-sigma factor
VIVAPSELDLATAPELARLLADHSVEALDLSRVTFIDAAGVRVLLAGVTRAGRPLQLRAPSLAVRRVLELAALSDLVSPHAA